MKPKDKQENATVITESSISQTPNGLAIINDLLFKIERISTPTTLTRQSARTHHYHDAYEMYYLYSGDRYYFIKDKTYHVKRGNLVLVKPYDIHCTSNFAKSGYDRILITFKKGYLDGFIGCVKGLNLFECFEKDIHIIQLNFQEQNYVETLLLSMINECKSGNPGQEYFLKTALMQLLIYISRYSGQQEDGAQSFVSAAHKTVSEVAAYINNNYSEPITLELVSKRFFVSPCYFSRTFKKVTGVPFNEYVNGVRIKEAQRLLGKTDMRISDVAEVVGYKSTTHFGRTFKSIVGMSPANYRRKRMKK